MERQREPDTTVLYQIVRANLEPFLRYTRDNYRRPLPRYVERKFRNYLRCGLLGEGFSRWRCPCSRSNNASAEA
jgi:hypothetical protein